MEARVACDLICKHMWPSKISCKCHSKYHVNAILGLYLALTFLGCAVFMFLFIVILPF
jgi:hypothetical protein